MARVRHGCLIGLWVLTLLALAPPGLAEINPQDFDLPVSMLAGTATPDPFTGAMVYRLPITLPPGRHGLQPYLELVYRSGNGNGWLGVGWKLELGKIERRRLASGAVSLAIEEYLFRLGGVTQELVRVADPPSPPAGFLGEYRAKIEGAFTRFQRLTAADGRAYWVATDRLGRQYRFGSTSSARLVEPVNQEDKIYEWLLDQVLDPPGNFLRVTYDVTLPGSAYLQRIDYTGWRNPSTGTVELGPTTTVIFTSEGRPDVENVRFPQYNVTGGQRRLKTIHVTANGYLVRAYRFTYSQSPSAGERSLLQRVQAVGKPTSVGADGTVTGGLPAPATTFTYAELTADAPDLLQTVANGLGVAILSTPKGVMSDARAREENVGGEILCNIF